LHGPLLLLWRVTPHYTAEHYLCKLIASTLLSGTFREYYLMVQSIMNDPDILDVTIQVRTKTSEREAIKKVAKSNGTTLSQWSRALQLTNAQSELSIQEIKERLLPKPQRKKH